MVRCSLAMIHNKRMTVLCYILASLCLLKILHIYCTEINTRFYSAPSRVLPTNMLPTNMSSQDPSSKPSDEPSDGAFGYNEPDCPCLWFGPIIGRDDQQSSCSMYSNRHGLRQQVVVYSYVAPTAGVQKDSTQFKRYLRQFLKRYTEVLAFYPNMILRLYHNISIDDVYGREFLCQISCKFSQTDLCDVNLLPQLEGVPPAGWVLDSLGDVTVDLILERHVENKILDRESFVVKKWLQSEKLGHVMRDHPNHRQLIVPGLWALRNHRLEALRAIRDELFDALKRNATAYEEALEHHIWPFIKDDVLQYDSYNCHREGHEGSLAFPTEREGGLYCGWGPYKKEERAILIVKACPSSCRPTKHKHWFMC